MQSSEFLPTDWFAHLPPALPSAPRYGPDLFVVFIRERVYLDYARHFLPAEHIDRIDRSRIPGVSPELATELAAGEATG